jgi:hypothetical protein
MMRQYNPVPATRQRVPPNDANFGIGTAACLPVCGATAANSGPTALTLASAPGIVTL